MSTLRRWPDSAGPPPITVFPRGFISPAQLSATAWEVASETGVVRHINYPIVLRVSQAYAQQRRYDDQSRNIGQVFYAELYRGGPASIAANYRHVTSLVSAFWYRERQLLAMYDSTLAKIATDTIRATDSTRKTPP